MSARIGNTPYSFGSNTVVLPASTLAAAGTKISSTSTTYNAQGQVAETTNAAGLHTGTVYYSDGEVQYTGQLTASARRRPYTTGDFISYTQYLYNQVDSSGQLYNRVIDADGHHTDTYTDLLGRTIKTVFDDGSFTETLYGVSGNLVVRSDLTPPTAAEGWTGIPSGGSEKVEIAQRKAGDPAVATYYVSDASGNLTDVWQPAVPGPNNGGALARPHTHYGYDPAGDEISQTDANNHTTTFTFDPNGDELTRTLPPAAPGDAPNTESFTYNVYNQVATHIDFDGNTATYTYLSGSDPNAGSLYRVVYVGAPNSGKATQTVTYVLDDMGRQHQIIDSAEATAADPTGLTTDSYDPEGDLIEQDTPQGIIHHAFDPATGQLIETWTNFTDIAYGYNPLGELKTTTVNKLNGQTLSAPLVTADYYDPAGNKKTETLPDGEQTTWNDDDLNRLLGVSEVQDSAVVFAQTFVLNDDGTRASSHQVQLQPGGSTVATETTWSNDALGRLTSETLSSSDPSQNYTDAFSYDLVGNRLTSTHAGPGGGTDETITYNYNNDDEMTEEVDVANGVSTETDLKYDANGSLTTSGPPAGPAAETYAYDVRNKIVSADVNGVTTTYVCDDAGNRVAETTNPGTPQAATTLYLTDDANPTGYAQPIEQKSSAAAAPSVTYIIGDRVLAQAGTGAGAVAVSYLLPDGHGSVRALTNSAGAVTQTFNYTAFGGALGFTPSASTPIYLFGGDAVFDYASGLYMNGDDTRDRLPGAGGFIEADPPHGAPNNEDPTSLHTYLYANAGPTIYNDPSGHDGELAGLLVAAGITFTLEALFSPNIANAPGPGDATYSDRGGDQALDAVFAVAAAGPLHYLGEYVLGPTVRSARQAIGALFRLGVDTLAGHSEWIVADSALASRTLAQLEAAYTKLTGVVPREVPGLENKIDTVTGRITLGADQPEAFKQGFRAEELNHYFQLRVRGWLGRSLSGDEVKLLEDEMAQDLMPLSGFAPYEYRNFAPYTSTPRPAGL